MKFSSPLGDGLVPSTLWMVGIIYIFSSPLGDGVVLPEDKDSWKYICIFVPEWGWVGSELIKKLKILLSTFRPRVGMGWFQTR